MTAAAACKRVQLTVLPPDVSGRPTLCRLLCSCQQRLANHSAARLAILYIVQEIQAAPGAPRLTHKAGAGRAGGRGGGRGHGKGRGRGGCGSAAEGAEVQASSGDGAGSAEAPADAVPLHHRVLDVTRQRAHRQRPISASEPARRSHEWSCCMWIVRDLACWRHKQQLGRHRAAEACMSAWSSGAVRIFIMCCHSGVSSCQHGPEVLVRISVMHCHTAVV